MTTISTQTEYTPEEVSRLSDETGKLYELVDGALVEKVVMSQRSIWVATQLSFRLNTAYDSTKAYVFVEQPTYCFENPRQMRRPDVALVWANRLPGGLSDDDLHIPPDFVAEVVSPTNTFDQQVGRVAEYLEAGVPLVWVVQPARRWIHVYRQDGSVALLRAKHTVRDEPLLPGFVLNVADIFPPSSPAAAANPV
jgi:Uma2 family endonuclease